MFTGGVFAVTGNIPDPEWARIQKIAGALHELLASLAQAGRFDRHVTDLSWRLAALLENGKALAVSLTEEEQFERSRFFERMGYTETELMDALERLGRDPQWFTSCLQMEAAYRRACDKLLTDEQRARLLTALRLPLTRIEVESMMLQSADAASEAVLCLRENETSMSELARECDSACERRRVFLGDCSEEMQQALLSASPEEILAPQRDEEAFVVCRLISKTEPTLHDDEVIGRLQTGLQRNQRRRDRERYLTMQTAMGPRSTTVANIPRCG